MREQYDDSCSPPVRRYYLDQAHGPFATRGEAIAFGMALLGFFGED